MEFSIRHFKPTDISKITGIINHYILNSTAIYDYNARSTENQLEILTKIIQKGFPIYVATINQEVVGFGYYAEFRFKDAYQFSVEHSIYVHPAQLGKGIGKSLLFSLIEKAKKQKLHTMIGVIDSENTESIDFHLKYGFTVVAKFCETGYKFNRWLDTVWIQLML